MNNELCFKIENNDLYLEQVLVDYDNIPIFFLCKGKEKNYLSLCVDYENYNYIVVEISLFDIYDLLHGNISMRNSILKHKEYWMVFSGEDIEHDIVEYHLMNDIEQNCLPQEGACFKILTESMRQYTEIIDNLLLVQPNYISISKLKTGYEKELRNVIELTECKIPNYSAKELGNYTDWKNITLENEIVSELNDKANIYENSILAA